jgi:membrane protease YdiL (CAAX protease family)
VLGWLLSIVGLVLLIVAVTAGGSIAGVMFIAAVLILLGGLSSAAGYQIIHRALRPAPYFRGPSPVLLFALQLILVNILSAVLLIAGVPVTAQTGVGFLIASVVLLAGYSFVVWLYGLRSGALDVRGLGIPAFGVGRLLSDIAVGALVMLGVAFLDALWGGLLALLLNSSTPDVVPTPNTAADLLMVALGACLLVPIGEELFFRGYSLTAWLRDLGERSALIRSTIFFALVHVINILVDQSGQGALDGLKQAVLEVLVIAPVGLVLGWLFLRRGLVTSISGHAAFNLVGVLSLALVHGH